jgi:hypothetical protein
MTSTKEFLTLTQALLALSDTVIELRGTLLEIVRPEEKQAVEHLEEAGKGLKQCLDRLQELVNQVGQDVE